MFFEKLQSSKSNPCPQSIKHFKLNLKPYLYVWADWHKLLVGWNVCLIRKYYTLSPLGTLLKAYWHTYLGHPYYHIFNIALIEKKGGNQKLLILSPSFSNYNYIPVYSSNSPPPGPQVWAYRCAILLHGMRHLMILVPTSFTSEKAILTHIEIETLEAAIAKSANWGSLTNVTFGLMSSRFGSWKFLKTQTIAVLFNPNKIKHLSIFS